MKKAICILFCFIYFASSAGINFNIHYCGGKVKSLSLFHTDEKNCCGSKMKAKGCCKEKTVTYKVKDSQDNAAKILISKNDTKSFEFFGTVTKLHIIKNNPYLIKVPAFKEPPDIVYNDTYLVNRVFLI